MTPLVDLFHRQPMIALHLASALLALGVGAIVLWGRKGDLSHRTLGWTFVVALGTAALSSAFIRDHESPNVAGFTPIHLLTIVVAVLLPLGIWYIRKGRVGGHRKTMTNLYLGACIVAGLFTLLPGRLLGGLLWHQILAFPL